MRRLLQSSRRFSARASSSALPLLRLPTVLFPSQPLSLRLAPSDTEQVGGEPLFPDAAGMSLPAELVNCAWRDFDGKVVAVSCGHVGVELHLLADLTLDTYSTIPGVVHAVGGRRLRVLRSSCAQAGEQWRQATVEPLHDDIVTERRRERLCDEAARALTLVAEGTERRAFTLELSTLDDELGSTPSNTPSTLTLTLALPLTPSPSPSPGPTLNNPNPSPPLHP